MVHSLLFGVRHLVPFCNVCVVGISATLVALHPTVRLSPWRRVWKISTSGCGPMVSPDLYLTQEGPRSHPYTCQLSRLRCESHACELKTSISRRLTLTGQFLTPD